MQQSSPQSSPQSSLAPQRQPPIDVSTESKASAALREVAKLDAPHLAFLLSLPEQIAKHIRGLTLAVQEMGPQTHTNGRIFEEFSKHLAALMTPAQRASEESTKSTESLERISETVRKHLPRDLSAYKLNPLALKDPSTAVITELCRNLEVVTTPQNSNVVMFESSNARLVLINRQGKKTTVTEVIGRAANTDALRGQGRLLLNTTPPRTGDSKRSAPETTGAATKPASPRLSLEAQWKAQSVPRYEEQTGRMKNLLRTLSAHQFYADECARLPPRITAELDEIFTHLSARKHWNGPDFSKTFTSLVGKLLATYSTPAEHPKFDSKLYRVPSEFLVFAAGEVKKILTVCSPLGDAQRVAALTTILTTAITAKTYDEQRRLAALSAPRHLPPPRPSSTPPARVIIEEVIPPPAPPASHPIIAVKSLQQTAAEMKNVWSMAKARIADAHNNLECTVTPVPSALRRLLQSHSDRVEFISRVSANREYWETSRFERVIGDKVKALLLFDAELQAAGLKASTNIAAEKFGFLFINETLTALHSLAALHADAKTVHALIANWKAQHDKRIERNGICTAVVRTITLACNESIPKVLEPTKSGLLSAAQQFDEQNGRADTCPVYGHYYYLAVNFAVMLRSDAKALAEIWIDRLDPKHRALETKLGALFEIYEHLAAPSFSRSISEEQANSEQEAQSKQEAELERQALDFADKFLSEALGLLRTTARAAGVEESAAPFLSIWAAKQVALTAGRAARGVPQPK